MQKEARCCGSKARNGWRTISPRSLGLPIDAARAIVSHYEQCLPLECCGLLGGSDGSVRFVYSLTNAEDSAVAYTIAPAEHFGAWKHAEANGWEIIGAFHSHPAGPEGLSTTDLALAAEPDWVYVVVTGRGIKAYVLNGRQSVEIPVQLVTRQVAS